MTETNTQFSPIASDANIAGGLVLDSRPGKGLSADEFKKAAENQLREQGLLREVDPGNPNPNMEIPEGRLPEKMIYQALEENEDGDAALMVKLFKGLRLYDQRANPNAAWYYWNDHYWREDEQKEIFQLVNEVVGVYYEQRQREGWKLKLVKRDSKLSQEEREKKEEEIKQRVKALKAREIALQTYKRKTNVLRLASMGVNSLGYVGDQWDCNPWLLGCRNGVIDLKKGICRDGRPEDYIKTVSPIAWDNDADCPIWKKFLLEIFEGDHELVDFMQRLLGYAITGLHEEHIYPILWGEHGRNGKSTLLETLKFILGPMATKVPSQLVMQGLNSKGTGPNAMLMKLLGVRLAWTSEANKKDHLDTAIVKGLSGGDTISARNPYDRKEIDFQPQHLLLTLTNHLPQVDADDDAFWDRAILIPFNLSFVSNPQKPWERLKNPKLGDELLQEVPGILKWLVEGTQLWIRYGLATPEKLTTAKGTYRDNEDLIGHFLADNCFIELGNTSFRTKPKELYAVYKVWCQESVFNPLNQKHFHESVQKRVPIIKDSVRFYKGLIIKT